MRTVVRIVSNIQQIVCGIMENSKRRGLLLEALTKEQGELAKLIKRTAPPQLKREEVLPFLPQVPGVGKKTLAKLKYRNISTTEQLIGLYLQKGRDPKAVTEQFLMWGFPKGSCGTIVEWLQAQKVVLVVV